MLSDDPAGMVWSHCTGSLFSVDAAREYRAGETMRGDGGSGSGIGREWEGREREEGWRWMIRLLTRIGAGQGVEGRNGM